MKVRQFLQKLWAGLSTIQLVEIADYREMKLIDTLDIEEVEEEDYHGLGERKIASFNIIGTKIELYIA